MPLNSVKKNVQSIQHAALYRPYRDATDLKAIWFRMDVSYKTAFYLAEYIKTRTFCREVPVSIKMSEV